VVTSLYAHRHHGCRVDEFTWRGHRLIVLENEVLRLGVVATRGADLVELRHKPLDVDFLWHSPHPLLPPGQAVPTAPTPAGTFFDQYHGGWQESLPAGNGTPGAGNARLGLHGEVSSQPWDVRLLDDRQARVAVEFSVRGRRTPFWLRRTMVLESGLPFVRLEETLVNEGEEPVPYLWGHHPAFGPPFLAAGCILELPAAPVTVSPGLPRPRLAAGTYDAWPALRTADGAATDASRLPGKEARTVDTLYLDLTALGRAGRPGRAYAALRNPALGTGVALEWDPAVFPYVWSWQVFGGAYGYPFYGRAHLVAIEPFSAPIGSLDDALRHGHARTLGAGEALSTVLRAGSIPGDRPFAGFPRGSDI
jgi:galactose mutarotase-like enzyme